MPTTSSKRIEKITIGSELILTREELKLVAIGKDGEWVDLRSVDRSGDVRLKMNDDYGKGMGEGIRLRLIDVNKNVASIEISQSSGGYMFP